MAITDLTGTTWVINDIPLLAPLSTLANFSINFSSNETNYSSISFQIPKDGDSPEKIQYGSTDAFTRTGGWANNAYKTISFIDGYSVTNSSLIAWIEANATQVISYDVEISYNGSTITGMSDSGTEILDTKEKFMTDNITINYVKPSAPSPSGGDDLKNFIEQHDNASSFSLPEVSRIGAGAFAYCTYLENANFPSCSYVGSNAFRNGQLLKTAIFQSCTFVGAEAFAYCQKLSSVSFPICASFGSLVFAYCYSLTTINLPSCSIINQSAFYFCDRLTTISVPLCTSISGSAFCSCSRLTEANFSLCTTLQTAAFMYCTALSNISFPICTSIGNSCFNGCSSLTTASFSLCSYMGTSAFANCRSLTTAYFPSLSVIPVQAFNNCYALSNISFPICTSIGTSAFAYCSSLTTASFSLCSYMGTYAFRNCFKLVSLYLMSNSIITLQNSNAFLSTPIAGYTTSTGGVYGSIFVPSSLYSSYKTATNWQYYSSRFVSV